LIAYLSEKELKKLNILQKFTLSRKKTTEVLQTVINQYVSQPRDHELYKWRVTDALITVVAPNLGPLLLANGISLVKNWGAIHNCILAQQSELPRNRTGYNNVTWSSTETEEIQLAVSSLKAISTQLASTAQVFTNKLSS